MTGFRKAVEATAVEATAVEATVVGAMAVEATVVEAMVAEAMVVEVMVAEAMVVKQVKEAAKEWPRTYPARHFRNPAVACLEGK